MTALHYLPPAWRRRLRRVAVRTGLVEPVRLPEFTLDDIDHVCRAFFDSGCGKTAAWDALRHTCLRLPDWFRRDLDPLGTDYAAQQHRLWQAVAGVDRPYDAAVDEREHDWSHSDPVRTPGYFSRRDEDAVSAASDHTIATGMLLRHCGLRPGDWALEYGAGFAQGALALARLGVNVDTVDISPTFCDFVRRQAEFFQVPLRPFQGRFGLNPRPGERYRLVWFYESFHHCLDFEALLQALPDLLTDDGRVILAGEPIVERECAGVPYPWGIRLHADVVAVVRRQHWFELGFTEPFLLQRFAAAGFTGRRVDCEPTLFGRLHVFERRPPAAEGHP